MQKIYFILTIIISTLVHSIPALAQQRNYLGQGREGGDILFCRSNSSREFPADGWYSLDYVSAVQNSPNLIFAPADKNRIEQISKIVRVFNTELANWFPSSFYARLNNFITNLSNRNNSTTSIWVPVDSELIDVTDEFISDHPWPSNCERSLLQAVIFTGRLYFYDVVAEKNLTAELQMSFLTAHELLRGVEEFLSKGLGNEEEFIFFWNTLVHRPEWVTLKGHSLKTWVLSNLRKYFTDHNFSYDYIETIRLRIQPLKMLAKIEAINQEANQLKDQCDPAKESYDFYRTKIMYSKTPTPQDREGFISSESIINTSNEKLIILSSLLRELSYQTNEPKMVDEIIRSLGSILQMKCRKY